MNRLMLDFETLDIGECPVILSMGAVVFNEDEIIDQISAKIDQKSCLKIGCTISQSTLDWWDQQTPKAKEMTFGGTTPIDEAMLMIIALYKEHWCSEIWSRGAIADIRWTNNILDKLGYQKPWKYWEEMCFRTFLKYSPQVEVTYEGELHNALDDAINQAKHWIVINKQTNANKQILSQIVFNAEYFTDRAKNLLDEFVNDLLSIEDVSIKYIESKSLERGYFCELITGNEEHGTYSIFQHPFAHKVIITSCTCGHVHYLEDTCIRCYPDSDENYLGNGTPIYKQVFDENDLPF
ncbi:3'-5' exonuclease [Acinetobacter nosocomialis]|uniref:3'-5' exonuclease n=1 Tax=Acinetobacter nosocomialis TaxID=106654 RepID=UPI001B8190CF|nr:3'-5' exonuclease [Acinetobacter nosocomialis]MBR7685885.1 3'-5' exoribonuclease [Acinetobacter nosocomialis]MBR7700258.1 3'-5' exoribonuclease [Acinetobacter nosocomialis]MBR7759106.1 3'-5' exoribonuclease [Acinetobacter nosocomialis]MCE5995679.1 3'-5' exoribonuclease [Acinetobacter nosocomialis]